MNELIGETVASVELDHSSHTGDCLIIRCESGRAVIIQSSVRGVRGDLTVLVTQPHNTAQA